MELEQVIKVIPEGTEQTIGVVPEGTEKMITVTPELVVGRVITEELNVTPTEEAQTFTPDQGVDGFDEVNVAAIPADYVGSAITRDPAMTASGPTVTAAEGYYTHAQTETVASGSAKTPTGGITANPSITVSNSGLITATISTSESITPIVEEGYIVTGTAGTISFSGSATEQLTTVNGQTIAPTESVQTAVPALRFTKGAVKIGAIPADYVGSGVTRQAGSTVTPIETAQTVVPADTFVTGAIGVAAIPSDYVGSGVTQRSSSDLAASGATVTAPAGYYSAAATTTVASGTEGTPVATKSAVNNHAVTVTPSVVNTEGYISGGTKTGTAVTVSASELVSGTLSITQNTTGRDVTNYQKVDVAIPAPVLETVNTTYTATTSQQTSTITASTGYDAIGQVNVTVTAVTSGMLGNPNVVRSKDDGYFYETISYPNFQAGYITSAASLQTHLSLEDKTVTPTTTAQTVGPTGDSYYLNSVTVDAVPTASLGVSQASRSKTTTALITRFDWPNFVAGYMSSHPPVAASQILQNETVTPTTTAQTVTPTNNGYYLESVTVEAIPAGTAGTPTATKGAVSGHAVTVTPSVTNATGYITGGTITGTAVTVSASELVSGSQTITTNDTYDVTNLAEVVVSVSGGSPNLQTKTNINPTTSSQTITADAGYDGLSSVQINAMPSGSAKPAASISSTGATLSTATNAIVLTKSVSNVPDVTAGYVASGTAGTTNITLQAPATLQGATTYYPTTTDQTINGSRYLTGNQTIKAVSQTNLAAENIKNGTTISISNGNGNIWSVTGTYSGGGGGGGIGDLLATSALGTISTSTTQATNLNKTITVTSVNAYDLLIVETSVDTVVANRHTATAGAIFLTASSNVNTKNGATVANAKWNSKISSSNVTTTRASTSSYGIYPNSCTVTTTSGGTASIPLYGRYNSTQTGTINGSYTTRVYGVKLYDLIGG